MKNQRGYFDLLDWLENENTVEPQQFFKLMQTAFEIADLVYMDVAILPSGPSLHRLHHTLDPAVAQVFASMEMAVLMPVMKTVIETVRPLDWSTLRRLQPKSEALFTQMRDLGLATEGLCFPLVSRDGRSAFLAIGVTTPARDWPQYRRAYSRDLHTLAALFHAALIDKDRGSYPAMVGKPMLTRREREALSWAAAGKSYWEIAVILGISERTVRYFMANARRKLNVVSNTQAVAEAVWRGLISH